MKLALLIFFSTLITKNSLAVILGHTNADRFITIKGKVEVQPNGLDTITSSFRKVIVKHDDLLKHNKVEMHLFLKRTTFKVKISDIQDITKPVSTK
jgi:hypothetical protein